MNFEFTIPWDRQGRHRPVTRQISLEGPNAKDFVIGHISKMNEFYEDDLLLHLFYQGPNSGYFIDVGANIGNHSLFFAKFLDAKLICVEPFPSTADILEQNLKANGVAGYRIFRCVAGKESGISRPVPPEDMERFIGLMRYEKVEGPGDGSTIQVRRLDDMVDQENPISLIKIDVEGSEGDVLEGSEKIIDRDHPQIVIESGRGEERRRVDAFLKKKGYRCVGRFCATPTFHYVNEHHHPYPKLPLTVRAYLLWNRMQHFIKVLKRGKMK